MGKRGMMGHAAVILRPELRMIPADPGGVICGWLLQLMSDVVGSAAKEQRKLRKAVSSAVDAVLAEVGDDQARQSLRAALSEHFSEAPALSRSGSRLRDRLSDAVRSELAPLADPQNALGSGSFLDQIGISASWLAEHLTGALVDAIRDVVAAHDVTALAILLQMEETRDPHAGGQLGPPFMAPRLSATFAERGEIGAVLVKALLADPSAGPITLTGPGGFGKSTLAAWACHRAEVWARFPDGILWIRLGDRPDRAEQVRMLTDLIVRLTGDSVTYTSVSVAADAFAAALGERRVLLVIDGAWRAENVDPFLTGGPRCVRLVTSQPSALVPGQGIEVGAMTPAEAAALLGSGFPEAATESLLPLLFRSGGMPLVLGLLNGVLHSLRDRLDLSLADAVSQLAAELDRRGVGAADELAGIAAEGVKGTFDLSLDELAAVHGAEAVSRYTSLCAFPEGAPVPYRLLIPVWGLSELQTVTDAGHLLRRSLVTSADRDGVRLHSVAYDLLRRRAGNHAAKASRALLEAFRPDEGWHALPPGREFWPQLAYHLLQAGRCEELCELLRDLRLLVARLVDGGSLALESDVQGCPEDPYTASLQAVLHQEAHLLTGHDNPGDLALTLHSRLFSRPGLFRQLTHAADALPGKGLVAAHPLPDCADPRLSRVITGPCEADLSLAWPSGKGLLVSLSCTGATMRWWDPGTGRQQAAVTVFEEPVRRILMSPDGRYLAVLHERVAVAEGRAKIERWQRWLSVVDAASGTVIAVCQVPPHELSRSELPDITWATDSAALAFATRHGVRLWAPLGEDEPRTLALSQFMWARALALHPVAGMACLTNWGTLIWWRDPAASDRQETWDDLGNLGFTLGDYALAWAPDGRLLAMASAGRFLIIDPAGRRVVREVLSPGPDTGALSWRPDGNAVACYWNFSQRAGSFAVAELGPGAEPDQRLIFKLPGSPVTGAAWDPSGQYLAVATAEPVIQLWQPGAESADGRSGNEVIAAQWQPGGQLLAVTLAGPAGDVLRVVTAAAPEVPVWPAELVNPGPVAWSPDGRYLADNHGPIAIRDAETGEVIRELPNECGYGRRTAISWATQSHLVTTTSFYGTVELIDAASGEESTSAGVVERRQGGTVRTGVTVSLDGARIAVWYSDGGLYVLEMGTGARTVLDNRRRYGDACFLPCGSRLASTAEGEVVLWDLTARSVIARQRCEHAQCVAADQAGKHVAVITRPGKIALFEARTLERICQIAVGGTATICDFDSSGEQLAVAGSAGLYLFRVGR